jgi:endo-1,4-beta-D-glucanase Y
MNVRKTFLSALVACFGLALFVASCATPSTTPPTTCQNGQMSCGGVCTDVTTTQNCGACGKTCGNGQVCQSGSCQCGAGLLLCNGQCVASDSSHCGSCTTTCSGTQVCSNNVCSTSCGAGQMQCSGGACANLASDNANCGSCGRVCSGGSTCQNSNCACAGGQPLCGTMCCGNGQTCTNNQCVNPTGTGGTTGSAGSTGTAGSAGGTTGTAGSAGGTTGSAGRGGSSGGTGGTGGASPNACATPDTISNFEEGTGDPVVLPGVNVSGKWEIFNDKGAGATETMKVEATGDTTDCHKYALHTTGSGWAMYAGMGLTNLAGTAMAPTVYPNTKSYTGIKFRAKVGTTHPKNSPVRFNISTPWTEGTSSGGMCAGKTTATPEKAAVDCYQHLGRYLQDDYALTTEWKDITFCFDRDLYPLSLPTTITNAQREAVAANMLKVQFQFNQANDWTVSSYPTEGKYTPVNKTAPFDLWIDEVSFFTGECPVNTTFKSTGSAMKAFPQNKAPTGGSCSIATNAAKFNTAISQIYARWTKNFVRTDGGGLKVICPEQENGVTTSESMGYGMLIAAAMGDKDSFDKMWTYVKGKLSGGLMTWKPGQTGSATDGDEDIAYALYMANAQWGGYKSDADAMGSAFAADIANDVVSGGSNYKTVFNPSYFAPAAYRKFPGGYASAISKTYGLVNANINASTAGIPTDWADPGSGAPKTAAEVGAQVSSGLDGQVLGYDGARVAWRLGLDACTGSADASTSLNRIISFFATKYNNGDTIDFMKAGWVKGSGQPHQKSVDCQGSFIGPMGVAGMAVGGTNGPKFRDRAFRAMLDILDYGDFNHTYFPSTVGFLTLLLMSGNFPTP